MANTSPLPIIAAPPFRRNTATRHRRSVTSWRVERAARAAHAWLMNPLPVTRLHQVGLAGIYGGVAVVAGAVAAVVIR